MWTWIVLVERSTQTGRKAATLQAAERWPEKWMAETNLEARMSQIPPNIPDWLRGDVVVDIQIVWVAK